MESEEWGIMMSGGASCFSAGGAHLEALKMGGVVEKLWCRFGVSGKVQSAGPQTVCKWAAGSERRASADSAVPRALNKEWAAAPSSRARSALQPSLVCGAADFKACCGGRAGGRRRAQNGPFCTQKSPALFEAALLPLFCRFLRASGRTINIFPLLCVKNISITKYYWANWPGQSRQSAALHFCRPSPQVPWSPVNLCNPLKTPVRIPHARRPFGQTKCPLQSAKCPLQSASSPLQRAPCKVPPLAGRHDFNFRPLVGRRPECGPLVCEEAQINCRRRGTVVGRLASEFRGQEVAGALVCGIRAGCRRAHKSRPSAV